MPAAGVADDARDLPRARAAARVVEPDRARRRPDRARSSPNETAVGDAKSSGRSARWRATTPPPWNRGPARGRRSSSESTPDCTSADLSCATVHAGWRWRRSAAAPATCGAAMLVPESSAQPPPETDESTSTPGAATSGLSRSEIVVGPTDENSACVLRVGLPPISTAPTRDRALRVAGRRHRACAEVVVVVPGGDDGDDACRGSRVERARDDVAARLDLGLAAREVDDVHPVGDGRLDRGDDRRRVRVRAEPRVGLDEHLVVAEVRARRDAGDAAPARCGVSAFPAAIPATCVPWLESSSLERERALGDVARAFGANDARDDHLRRREPLLPLRESRRHRVSGRIEERVARVDPRVDDPDLHALTRRVERLRPRAPARRSAAASRSSCGA